MIYYVKIGGGLKQYSVDNTAFFWNRIIFLFLTRNYEFLSKFFYVKI